MGHHPPGNTPAENIKAPINDPAKIRSRPRLSLFVKKALMSRHCSSVKSVGYDLSFIAPLPQNLTPTRRVNNSPDQMSRDNNCLEFSKPCNGHALILLLPHLPRGVFRALGSDVGRGERVDFEGTWLPRGPGCRFELLVSHALKRFVYPEEAEWLSSGSSRPCRFCCWQWPARSSALAPKSRQPWP